MNYDQKRIFDGITILLFYLPFLVYQYNLYFYAFINLCISLYETYKYTFNYQYKIAMTLIWSLIPLYVIVFDTVNGIKIIAVITTSDICQYFGKLFKYYILFPSISPKKSLAGYVISILLTPIIFGYIDKAFSYSTIILLVISGFIGDILLSLIKRKLNIKDFSNFFASHGGFLDRFDGIYFAYFVFFITKNILSRNF